MFGIGFGEMMIVAVVLLIAVGPDKMPKLMKAVGKGLRQVRSASNELRKQSGIDELMREDPVGLKELQRDLARKPGPRRAEKLSADDLEREQPAEGVDLATARRQAEELRLQEEIAQAEQAALEDGDGEPSDEAAPEPVAHVPVPHVPVGRAPVPPAEPKIEHTRIALPGLEPMAKSGPASVPPPSPSVPPRSPSAAAPSPPSPSVPPPSPSVPPPSPSVAPPPPAAARKRRDDATMELQTEDVEYFAPPKLPPEPPK